VFGRDRLSVVEVVPSELFFSQTSALLHSHLSIAAATRFPHASSIMIGMEHCVN
jgi:hypothetical protein